MLFKGTSVSRLRVSLFTVDIDAVCKKNKTAIVVNPFNCAQYYDCSKQVSAFGKPYLQECKYPDLFSSGTNSCEPFTSVTGSCGRRKEAQAPCKTLYLKNMEDDRFKMYINKFSIKVCFERCLTVQVTYIEQTQWKKK